MTDRSIWRLAAALLARHGTDAALLAGLSAEERLASGDIGGCATWARVRLAIIEFEAVHGAPNRRAH